MSYAARPVFSYGEYKRFKNHASLHTAEEKLNPAVKYDHLMFSCSIQIVAMTGMRLTEVKNMKWDSTPYNLRHSYITEQLKNCVDVYILYEAQKDECANFRSTLRLQYK